MGWGGGVGWGVFDRKVTSEAFQVSQVCLSRLGSLPGRGCGGALMVQKFWVRIILVGTELTLCTNHSSNLVRILSIARELKSFEKTKNLMSSPLIHLQFQWSHTRSLFLLQLISYSQLMTRSYKYIAISVQGLQLGANIGTPVSCPRLKVLTKLYWKDSMGQETTRPYKTYSSFKLK